MSLSEAKSRLRADMTARRATLGRDRTRSGLDLADRFLSAISPAPGGVVSGFLPIGDEIDVMPLLARLGAAGHGIALPVVVGRGHPLSFRLWRDGDPLEAGPLGTRHPSPEAVPAEPDLLIVPLLAFDRRGYRLGYGGGYYDRTLTVLRAARPALAVGVGFAEQEVPKVPHDSSDAKLDYIVTDRESIEARGRS